MGLATASHIQVLFTNVYVNHSLWRDRAPKDRSLSFTRNKQLLYDTIPKESHLPAAHYCRAVTSQADLQARMQLLHMNQWLQQSPRTSFLSAARPLEPRHSASVSAGVRGRVV